MLRPPLASLPTRQCPLPCRQPPITWGQSFRQRKKKRASDLEQQCRGREFLTVVQLTTVTGKVGHDGQNPQGWQNWVEGHLKPWMSHVRVGSFNRNARFRSLLLAFPTGWHKESDMKCLVRYGNLVKYLYVENVSATFSEMREWHGATRSRPDGLCVSVGTMRERECALHLESWVCPII